MKYKVVFTITASDDLSDIWDFIASASSTNKADTVVNRLLELAHSLETLPYRYRAFGHEDYRCVPSGVYLIVYHVAEEMGIVFIETIFDNRQDPMKLKGQLV